MGNEIEDGFRRNTDTWYTLRVSPFEIHVWEAPGLDQHGYDLTINFGDAIFTKDGFSTAHAARMYGLRWATTLAEGLLTKIKGLRDEQAS